MWSFRLPLAAPCQPRATIPIHVPRGCATHRRCPTGVLRLGPLWQLSKLGSFRLAHIPAMPAAGERSLRLCHPVLQRTVGAPSRLASTRDCGALGVAESACPPPRCVSAQCLGRVRRVQRLIPVLHEIGLFAGDVIDSAEKQMAGVNWAGPLRLVASVGDGRRKGMAVVALPPHDQFAPRLHHVGGEVTVLDAVPPRGNFGTNGLQIVYTGD